MGEASYTHDTYKVDDFYFSALSIEEELFPISDEKYAQELQLQEVLISSVTTTHRRQPPWRPQHPIVTQPRRREKGGSSSSRTCQQAFCKICMEAVPDAEMFENSNCSHVFCRECLSRYIGAKLRENICMVKCPEVGCKGVLELEFCREIVPPEVFERWESVLSESMVLSLQRFYCPYKDCLAMLVDDGEETLRQSECPSCRRLFCAQCQVPWHAAMGCEEFQKLGVDETGREDLLLMEVARSRKWKRCPRCKFFVEKTDGCLHITCRCGFQFCYGCGSQWSVTHARCGA